MRLHHPLFAITGLLLTITFSSAQYRCDWNLISAGGATTTAGNLSASVSVAQTAVGSITGTNFNATIGFWQIDTPTVSIKEVSSKSFPLRTELLPARPNPFSRETKIFYSLAKEADVCLRIYNTCGQIVNSFFFPKQKPGIYSVSFSADEKDYHLPRGIYFYKFTAGNYERVRKFTLIR